MSNTRTRKPAEALADPPVPQPSRWRLDVDAPNAAGDGEYGNVLAWNYNEQGLSLVTSDGHQIYYPIRSIAVLEATPVYEETP